MYWGSENWDIYYFVFFFNSVLGARLQNVLGGPKFGIYFFCMFSYVSVFFHIFLYFFKFFCIFQLFLIFPYFSILFYL